MNVPVTAHAGPAARPGIDHEDPEDGHFQSLISGASSPASRVQARHVMR
jgi:hypothetical protein